MDENDAKREIAYTSPGAKLEAKIHTFLIFWYVFWDLFSEWRLGRLPGPFLDRFWMVFGLFFDDFLDILSCSPHKWKCHSDSLFTMYEAHGRYRK